MALTRICLDPSGVRRVGALDVFEENVVDVVHSVVPDGPDDHATRFVTSDVVDVHVRGITLGANAVLTMVVKGVSTTKSR